MQDARPPVGGPATARRKGGKAEGGEIRGKPEDLPEPVAMYPAGVPGSSRGNATNKIPENMHWVRRTGLCIVAGMVWMNLVLAQSSIQLLRVFVLNEGRYDYWNGVQVEPVTVGVIDILTGKYQVIDTIVGARFGVDLEVDSGFLYVTADSYLIKYDLSTLEEVARAVAPGFRGFTIHGNYIYVTRGDMNCCSSYLQVYDKRTLSLVWEADTASTLLKWHSEDVLVWQDSLYLIANNAFVWGGYVGYLVRAPLSQLDQMDTFNLGPEGYNPANLMTDGGKIYTLNNLNFTTSSISIYDPGAPDTALSQKVQTVNLNLVSGCIGSTFAWDKIYFKPFYSDTGGPGWGDEVPSTEVLRFSPALLSIVDTLDVNRKDLYQFHYEPLTGTLWVTETDFVNWGLVLVFDSLMRLVDAYPAGVGAGALAFEYGIPASVQENGLSRAPQVTGWVLPGRIYLRRLGSGNSRFQQEDLEVRLMDFTGRHLLTKYWDARNPLLEVPLPVTWGTYLLEVRDYHDKSPLLRVPVVPGTRIP